MNLDAIFLDKLDQYYCKRPKLWAPHKNCYVTLIKLDEKEIVLKRYNGRLDRMPRQSECEQTMLWPSKTCKDWNKWREYLFEDRVDFIAPLSYIMQVKGGDHCHLTECINILPYLITNVKKGEVINVKGEKLTIDINKYRFAKESEIQAFLDVARFIDIDWNEDKEVWSWAYRIPKTKPNKFIPGDLVAIKDHITGELFEGCYSIREVIEEGDGKYKYKLLCDNYWPWCDHVIMDEENLVKCRVVVEGMEEKKKEKDVDISKIVKDVIDGVINDNKKEVEEETDFLL